MNCLLDKKSSHPSIYHPQMGTIFTEGRKTKCNDIVTFSLDLRMR